MSATHHVACCGMQFASEWGGGGGGGGGGGQVGVVHVLQMRSPLPRIAARGGNAW